MPALLKRTSSGKEGVGKGFDGSKVGEVQVQVFEAADGWVFSHDGGRGIFLGACGHVDCSAGAVEDFG